MVMLFSAFLGMVNVLILPLVWYPIFKLIKNKYKQHDRTKYIILLIIWNILAFVIGIVLMSMFKLVFIDPQREQFVRSHLGVPETVQQTAPQVQMAQPAFPPMTAQEKSQADWAQSQIKVQDKPQINPVLLAQMKQQNQAAQPVTQACKEEYWQVYHHAFIGKICGFETNLQQFNKEACQAQDLKQNREELDNDFNQRFKLFSETLPHEKDLVGKAMYCQAKRFNSWGEINGSGEKWRQVGILEGGDKVFVANKNFVDNDLYPMRGVKIENALNPNQYFIGGFMVLCSQNFADLVMGAMIKDNKVLSTSERGDFGNWADVDNVQNMVANYFCRQ